MAHGWDKPLTDFTIEVRNFTNAEIKKLAAEALTKIKARTPVRSGELQASWYIDQMVTNGIVEITILNDQPYAIFVEYGTQYMAGVHMLEQTINEITYSYK